MYQKFVVKTVKDLQNKTPETKLKPLWTDYLFLKTDKKE